MARMLGFLYVMRVRAHGIEDKQGENGEDVRVLVRLVSYSSRDRRQTGREWRGC